MTSVELSHRDLAAVVDAAEWFVDSGSLESLRQRTVEVVSSLVPSTMVSWNEVDLRGRRIAAVLSASAKLPSEPETIREYDEAFIAYVGDHPVISHYQQTHDGRPYAISDFLSVEAFHRTDLYQRFYRMLATEDQISFVLPDPRLVIGIAISRDERGFGDRERAICRLLRAYIVQAFRNIDARAHVEHLLSTVYQLAEDHGEAALMLNRDGMPERVSPHARELLEQFYGAFDARWLPAEVASWLDAQTGTVFSPLIHERGDHSLVIRRVRDTGRDVLLLFRRAREDAVLEAQQLGLTTREAQVATLLTGGLTTKRIATTLTISPRTVDKHIAAILDKLSVQTRLEAISLLAGRRGGGPPPQA